MSQALRLYDQTLPNQISLSCRAAGEPDNPRRVLFLHGFPEAAFVWDELMQALAPQALCVAPNLRGYERSSAPADASAYRAKHVVGDVAALIDAMGAPVDLLVAHDWGGGLAWNLAALSPERLRHLVIINSPHPATFLRELRDNPAQQRASTYMNALVQPDAAARYSANDFALLWQVLSKSGQPAWLSDAVRAQYRAVWSRGLDGALNYYRASPLRPPTGPDDQALQALQLPDSVVCVNLPTTVLWGEGDHALLPGLLDGLCNWVPKLTVHRHAQASHWIVHEEPQWVLGHLKALLASQAG